MEFLEMPYGSKEQTERLMKEVEAQGMMGVMLPMPTPDPLVVTLCGSTRFWKQFQEASLMFTFMDNIVLSIGSASATDEDHGITPEQKDAFDRLHLAKIQRSSFVFVLNVDGYIGQSTAREIVFAKSIGLPVFWHDRTKVLGDFEDIINIANGHDRRSDEDAFVVDYDPYPWDGYLRRIFGIRVDLP